MNKLILYYGLLLLGVNLNAQTVDDVYETLYKKGRILFEQQAYTDAKIYFKKAGL